jgi:ubiquinone/menaquinone biosynthesis C-methylase UbiE
LDVQRIVSAIGVVQGSRAAHLGCGGGFVTMALARAVGPNGVVTAVDIMEEPLQTVRAKAEAAGFTNVRAVRANLEVSGDTKIPDQSQDIVAVVNVLFQSRQKGAILAEAVRVLKPAGKLVLVEWKKGAGGFGPPNDLRTDDDALKSLALGAGARFERTIDAGGYHSGMLFTR